MILSIVFDEVFTWKSRNPELTAVAELAKCWLHKCWDESNMKGGTFMPVHIGVIVISNHGRHLKVKHGQTLIF